MSKFINLGRLFGGDADEDDDRFNGKHGVDKVRHGGHNPHPAEIYDGLTGLTLHEKEVFEEYLKHGLRDAAETMGMNRGTVHAIVNNVKDKLDLRGSQNELYKWYKDEYGAPEGYTGSSESAADNTTDNYTDQSVEGGDHPWLYDSEGNYIG